MLRIAIIIGSTRPGRVGGDVGHWVFEQAQKRKDAIFELIDLKTINLPLLDEPEPPSRKHYTRQHTKEWSEKIASYDGFIFVTAEYNHGIPAALKNAIDFLYSEWNNKAAGFVAYGSMGGARVVEQLRMVMGELQVADVREQVAFSLMTDFENFKIFKPASYHEKKLDTLIDQLLKWSGAMKTIR